METHGVRGEKRETKQSGEREREQLSQLGQRSELVESRVQTEETAHEVQLLQIEPSLIWREERRKEKEGNMVQSGNALQHREHCDHHHTRR